MSVLLIGDAATRCGVESWQLRRLDQRGLIAPPARIGRYRAYMESDLPAIEAALRKAKYIKSEPAA